MSPEALSGEVAAGSRQENASGEANPPARWHPALVALHWLTLILIAAQFLIASPMQDETRNLVERFELYQLHKSIGLTVAGFVVARLLLRLLVKPPPSANDGRLLRFASDAVHAGLYLCVVALPVTGLLLAASSPIQIPTLYFGLFQVPHPIGPDKATYELMLRLHDFAGNALLALGAVHFAAAAVHVVFWRDNLLRRMWFGSRKAQPSLRA
ncbi:cytochrome b [Bosea caraganae]|uniref:Cytochrome b n=1 Tax=Bosea caraganae TaxID=2763117 RepID=A0A370L742_9HYPH|nr:cytochrome b/b6 domain-containing protein [Bosea caraganae]RDJ24892.1 cytochrome b [Bosea caraganae]RDJ26004.1 cytochrome b [Bosea caraganae]